jgi:EmrB/QacA subfamily drug resistance transporter
MPPVSVASPRPEAIPATPERSPALLRHSRGRSSLFLFVVLTAQLMVVLDTTIVNVALPHIQRSLGFSGPSLSWVLNAYILTFGGLLLLGARAGDLVGRRQMFLTGVALFSLSSLAGGFAATGWMLLAARAVQGIGGALAAPSSLSLLTAMFPEGPARVRAIGLYTTVSAAGGATGLVAGGLLTELVSWRWVMFVNVPIGLVIWLVGRVVLQETAQRHGRFDLVGAATSTLGMTGIVLGLVESGSAGWTSPVTVASFALGLTLLAAFVHNESRAEEPILPLRLLAHSTRSTANVARGLLYAGMYSMFYFLSQFLQDVQSYHPLRAGVAFLPMPMSVFVASQLTSKVLVPRIAQKRIMLFGIGLSTLGLLWASRLHTGAPYVDVFGPLVLMGMGAGTSFVSLTSASLTDVEPRDAGAASGLINVMQQVGAALGLAVLVTAFGALTHHVQLGARTGADALAHTHAVLVHGLDDVFGLGVVFTLAALVVVAVVIRGAPGASVEAEESAEPESDERWRAIDPAPPPVDIGRLSAASALECPDCPALEAS